MDKNLKMIRTMIPVVCIFFVGCLGTPKWTDFSSTEGRFKIEFPDKPNEMTKTVETDYGQLPIHFAIYEASKDNDKNLGYTVSYVDYPDSVINSDKNEMLSEFFKNLTQKAVNTLHGKLDHEATENIKNYPGEEIKISFKDGQVVYREKTFLVKNRLYSVIVLTDAKEDFNKSIDHFFSTFELL